MRVYRLAGGRLEPIDVVALAEVVVSRTVQVYGSEKGQSSFEPLTEVDLANYDVRSLETQWKQAISSLARNSKFLKRDANANSNVEDGPGDVVSKAEDILTNGFMAYRFMTHQMDNFEDHADATNLHHELDQEMRTMENLDLEKYQDVAILGRRSIPHLLHSVSQLFPNTIPGDNVFEFRFRAKKLLYKWKPFILRDVLRDSLADPYIWKYERTGYHARLLCRRPVDETANEA
ncbi:hypothetical protein H1R20_g10169, partial [Candolleomyces eurysporus]